ncbi:hypothetical protein JKP88DRAFT_249406 [Tribonema minus]|uniref:Uncharacterized protein n=1 Tax=Tribonema minus TaxID=303371 RepID=A0A836C864_9STRA|nr:hypothetical protein JKP88DRAFT_249406 [Tribonema minus]
MWSRCACCRKRELHAFKAGDLHSNNAQQKLQRCIVCLPTPAIRARFSTMPYGLSNSGMPRAVDAMGLTPNTTCGEHEPADGQGGPGGRRRLAAHQFQKWSVSFTRTQQCGSAPPTSTPGGTSSLTALISSLSKRPPEAPRLVRGGSRCKRKSNDHPSPGSAPAVTGHDAQGDHSDAATTCAATPSPRRGTAGTGFKTLGGSGHDDGDERCCDNQAAAVHPPLPLQFNLRQWKEYAAARHAANGQFRRSALGWDIMQDMAEKIRTAEVAGLHALLEERDRRLRDAAAALAAERGAASDLRRRVVTLQAHAGALEEAARRAQRDAAAGRARGSNLERRLAAGPGGLKGFLHGPDPPSERDPPSPRTPSWGGGAGGGSPAGSMMDESFKCGGDVRGRDRKGSGAGKGVPAGGMSAADARKFLENAELERGEERRRHARELTLSDEKAERLRGDVKRLQGERAGLQAALEAQAAFWAAKVAAAEDVARRAREGAAVAEAALAQQQQRAAADAPPATAGQGEQERRLMLATEEGLRHQIAQLQELLVQCTAPRAARCNQAVHVIVYAREGLRHQIVQLQELLVQAVAAAYPTIALPPAVLQAAAGIRGAQCAPPPRAAAAAAASPQGAGAAAAFAQDASRRRSTKALPAATLAALAAAPRPVRQHAQLAAVAAARAQRRPRRQRSPDPSAAAAAAAMGGGGSGSSSGAGNEQLQPDAQLHSATDGGGSAAQRAAAGHESGVVTGPKAQQWQRKPSFDPPPWPGAAQRPPASAAEGTATPGCHGTGAPPPTPKTLQSIASEPDLFATLLVPPPPASPPPAAAAAAAAAAGQQRSPAASAAAAQQPPPPTAAQLRARRPSPPPPWPEEPTRAAPRSPRDSSDESDGSDSAAADAAPLLAFAAMVRASVSGGGGSSTGGSGGGSGGGACSNAQQVVQQQHRRSAAWAEDRAREVAAAVTAVSRSRRSMSDAR